MQRCVPDRVCMINIKGVLLLQNVSKHVVLIILACCEQELVCGFA